MGPEWNEESVPAQVWASTDRCKDRQRETHSVYVLYDVLEGRVGPEGGKETALVQQGVDQVGVVVQRVGQTGVDNLQHHAQHLLQHAQVLHLQRSMYGPLSACTVRAMYVQSMYSACSLHTAHTVHVQSA